MTWLDDPDGLWQSTRLGREEYVQKLLAALIVGHGDTRWNARQEPTQDGEAFLRRLFARAGFGELTGELTFVDEFELPARHDGEKAGWPDHAVLTDGSLFVIELKTERRSHRPDQLPHYLDLSAHHHGGLERSLLYITPEMDAAPPTQLHDAQYAHLSWTEVLSLVRETWANRSGWEANVVARLGWWVGELEAGRPLPDRGARTIGAPPFDADALLDEALRLADATQEDREQRALDAFPTDPEDLETLRLDVRDALETGSRAPNVRPWIWRAETSGGTPLTEAGTELGIELRFSYYSKAREG